MDGSTNGVRLDREVVNRMLNYIDAKGDCPICGEPSHVAFDPTGGTYLWVHDDLHEFGFLQEHVDDVPVIAQEQAERMLAQRRGETGCLLTTRKVLKRAVTCLETGERFRTIGHAANRAYVSVTDMAHAVASGDACGGYHWKYV